MLDQHVSPPCVGMLWMCRIEAIGGSSSADTSECQRSPLLRNESLSVWIRISSGFPCSYGAAG